MPKETVVNWFDTDVVTEAVRTCGSRNCPNCGAAIESEKCRYCGTVFIDFAAMDADKPFFIKIKQGDKIFLLKVQLAAASTHCDTIDCCDVGSRYIGLSCPTELTMDFIIVP